MPLPGLLRLKRVTFRVKLAVKIATKRMYEHSSARADHKQLLSRLLSKKILLSLLNLAKWEFWTFSH